MWRYPAIAFIGLLLVGGIYLVWHGIGQGKGSAAQTMAAPPATATAEPLDTPPQATDLSKEERRFNRYDRNRNGDVSIEEYLTSRRKAYAKLDANGDGRLDFDEWAVKTKTKFAHADTDHSGILTPAEFATTKVSRKASKPVPCVAEPD